MSRYARDNRPRVKPVQKIQLSEENTARRAVAAVLLLILGGVALAYAFSQMFTPETGWQTIQAGTADGPTCAEEFTLAYEIGADGREARSEMRALSQAYTSACRKAFQLFHTTQSFDGVTNLRDLNAHPNEVLTVDPVLYAAFQAVEAAGDRTVYLGPVCARYGDLFACQDDSQLVDFDPWVSEEVAEEYAAYAAYAGEPAHINVELLENSQVCLRVSEEYLAFAAREGVERFLDFGWMRNAFVADYLADTLIQAGFTNGLLSSTDGFARCLDERGNSFVLTLYGWEGMPIEAGTMKYQGPMSLINLRTFPVSEKDWQRCYLLRDGQLRTFYLDPADGKSRTSVDLLTCWSEEESCAGLAMAAAPVFIAGAFDPAPLERPDVHTLWCRDRVFDGTDPLPEIQNLYQVDGVSYTLSGGA